MMITRIPKSENQALKIPIRNSSKLPMNRILTNFTYKKTPMKNILTPTDFSLTSRNAVNFAIEIAKKCSGTITVLNIYSVPIYDPNMPAELLLSAINEAEKAAKENLERVKQEMANMAGADVNINTADKQGLIVDEILTYAEEHKTDMIVMGTTGASGFLEKIIGSNTARVISEAQTPVLAVPDKAAFNGIGNIVYATDLNDPELPEINKLKDFASNFGATITLLHVCDEKESILIDEKDALFKDIQENVKYEKIKFELIENEDVTAGIDNFVSSNKVDVIAMATHKRSLLGRIFNTSLTQKMVYHCRIPLLALHREA
jgi:nucleotide-binding universal stress UspA family protein